MFLSGRLFFLRKKDILGIVFKEKMGKIDYEMIVRYFNGKCQDDEKRQIIRWANESDEYARQLFEWEELYFLGKRADESEKIKLQQAERRLFERIREEEKAGNGTRKVFRLSVWMKYAEVIALVVAFSGLGVWYLGDGLRDEWKTVATAEGKVVEVVLPDSSRVWVNENSVLEYPERFTEKNRRLRLSGEAYFEVTKDRHKPFIVCGEDMNVQVLGTKFNFKNAPTCRIVEASLLEGEIKAEGVHTEGTITLSPGQKVELNKGTGQMKVMATDAMLDAVWHSDMVRLQNAGIIRIARLLEEIYDVTVILSPDVEKVATYSGELKKKGTATEMLDALKQTLHIEYKKHNDVIFVSPDRQ